MSDKIIFKEEMFEKAEHNFEKADALSKPSLTYWADVWRRLRQNKLAMVGLGIIIILVLMAIFAPMFSPFTYEAQDFANKNVAPNSTYWFGTDSLGRDLWTRAWHGARISLMIGTLATLIEFMIGAVYGGVSGSIGGRVDNIMMRFAEILYSIPYMLIVILFVIVLGRGLFPLIIAMVITGWMSMARLARGQVLQLKQQDYVQASEALGSGMMWRLRKHLIPNMLGPILVNLTLSVPTAIFAESTLSFLGLGVQAPKASWGSMANEALTSLFTGFEYQLLVPAILISLTMFAFNVLGDGLRDALDPQLRK